MKTISQCFSAALHGINAYEITIETRLDRAQPKYFIVGLAEKAQEMFDVFVSLKVVPESQLFGGKIIAALDRQHPRERNRKDRPGEVKGRQGRYSGHDPESGKTTGEG